MADNPFARLRETFNRLGKISREDIKPLMEEWQRIVQEDNRTGILQGLDAKGRPMAPTTYRNSGALNVKHRKSSDVAFGVPTNLHPLKGIPIGRQLVRFKGIQEKTANNNLTTEQYQQLTGPPLAPRGASSRVIANFQTMWDQTSDGEWFVKSGWDQVVSPKGVPFLMAHFTGARTGRGHKTKLPRRDLRGVRPWGIRACGKALAVWIDLLVRKA